MSRLNKILVLLALCASFSFAGPVYVYGALKACKDGAGKGRICGSKGSYTGPVQLRGVSLGWSNTTSESSLFFNDKTIDAMVDGWKAEVIRVPLGIGGSPSGNGYDTESQADANWNRVQAAVDAAIAKDVYVIIDWHAHAIETSKASNFFANVATKYHNKDHVIFEIFNEPRDQDNGTWANIRTYANSVVSAIRAKGAKNLILVGTPNWSQDVDAVTTSTQVTDSENNIGYVLHFYAATHTRGSFGSKVNTALNNGFPVFVTEYGTTDASGGNPTEGNYESHNPTNTNAWYGYLDSNKISSCAWQVSDREEGAAFFGLRGKDYGWFKQNPAEFINESNMTASGKYIFGKLKGYANNTDEPWRKEQQPSSSSGGSGSTLIDNFEDGDSLARTFERWFVYTDSDEDDKEKNRGASTIANTKTQDDDYRYIAVFQDGTNWVAGVKNYNLSKGTLKYDPFVAIGLDAKNNQTAYDLSKCTGGFSYKYKGVAHKFKILQSDVTDYNYHLNVTPASASTWATATVPLNYFDQEGWGSTSPVVARDIKKVKGFAWEVNKGVEIPAGTPTPTTGSLLIDDFTCLGDMPITGGGTSSPSGGSSSSKSSSSVSGSGGSSSSVSGGSGSSSSRGSSSSVSGSGGSSSSRGSSSSVSGSGTSSSSRSSTSTGGASSSSVGTSGSGESSSSGGGTNPIVISKIANANAVQLIKNGVSLQVIDNATLEVFNLNGKLFRKLDFSSGVYSIQLQDMPKGLYIVKANFGSRREVLYVPIR